MTVIVIVLKTNKQTKTIMGENPHFKREEGEKKPNRTRISIGLHSTLEVLLMKEISLVSCYTLRLSVQYQENILPHLTAKPLNLPSVTAVYFAVEVRQYLLSASVCTVS